MFELLHMPRRKGAFSPLLSAKSYLGGIIGLLLPSLVLSLSLPIFLAADAAADVATDDAVDAQQYEAPILLRVPPPCGCRHAPPGTGRVGPGIVPDGGRLAYLVEAHNGRTVDDALNLFRAIRYPGTIILFHIDTEFPPAEYAASELAAEIASCSCGADVRVERKFSPNWGTWDMNDPTHWAMDVLTFDARYAGKWDVFINLSGDTMPVLTPERMAQLFAGPLRGINFVTAAACETGLRPTRVWDFPDKWHKKVHYTHDNHGKWTGDSMLEYRDDEGNLRVQKMTTYFGSQWMFLTSDFVGWLARSLRRADSLPSVYRAEFIELDRLMSDETFISTLIMHTPPFNNTLPKLLSRGSVAAFPKIYATRYERMDEHVPTAFGLYPVNQRYDVPESSTADKPRVWGPYFLGVYDLAAIIDSGALFVRKVSVTVDRNIVDLLPVNDWSDLPYIGWPEEIELTKKPNWKKQKEELMKKAKKERGLANEK